MTASCLYPDDNDGPAAPRLAFYLPSLVGHGAEKVLLYMAEQFAQDGYAVDVLVDEKTGEYLGQVPNSVAIVGIQPRNRVRAYLSLLRIAPGAALALFRPLLTGHKPFMRLWQLGYLVDYIGSRRPVAIISALHFPNILSIWACRIARAGTKAVVTERSPLSKSIEAKIRQSGKKRRGAYRLEFIARAYPLADAIVAVSNGVADDLSATAGVARDRIHTIYNPFAIDDIQRQAEQPAGCPWLDQGDTPVVLAVGRLIDAKGFDVLLDAFCQLHTTRTLRLVILGEGEQRVALEQRVDALGLAESVCLPGWVANPYAWMARASVFVLSSWYEGLPGVLIQAMGCGCPPVATDCPGGTREILAGVTDDLIAPGDPAALAAAIDQQLRQPLAPERLKRRAADFGTGAAVSHYQRLIDDLQRAPGPR